MDLALKDVTFVDSSGLSVLISAALRGQKAGRSFNIISMTAHLNHMLSISGLEHLFGIPTTEERPHEEGKRPIVGMYRAYLQCKGEKSACRIAREQVCEFARNMGFDQMSIDDIRLAVGEAVSNAVRHGAECGQIIKVRCERDTDKLIVKLSYSSAEFDPLAVPTPSYATAAEGGMGIHFMRLCDG